jgi:hypothetical protein
MNADRNLSTASAGGHRKSVAEEPVTSVLAPGEVPIFDRELSADEEVLAALGYQPEFKREFSLWTSFCVSFAVLGLLPSFASTLYYGMGYAGTPGMVWGWLIAMGFIQCIAMGMGRHHHFLTLGTLLSRVSGTVFLHANFWRSLLRSCGIGAPRLWPSCFLAYRMVELACASHWRPVGQLCTGIHDPGCRLNEQS